MGSSGYVAGLIRSRSRERQGSLLAKVAKRYLATIAATTTETAPPPSTELPLARYRTDPVGFAREVLGIVLWSRQREILEAIRDHNKVAVRSGHKVGKSTTAAVAALWFVCCFPGARVILTSASGRQVKAILWKELRRLYRNAVHPIGGKLNLDPGTGLQFDDGREVLGYTTDDAERMAGISGEHVLYLVDEASGVAEAIWEAIEGNRAGGAKLAAFSNPTRTSGTFCEAFKTKGTFWHRIHVRSAESPNVTGTEPAVPGLATKEWLDEKRDDWGTDSPLFQVRAEGNFPSEAENAVIGLGLVQAATQRHATMPDEGALSIGVDPARFGDDETGIAPVRGKRAHAIRTLRSMDTVDVAGQVLAVCAELGRDGETIRVQVDETGLGAGVLDTLRRHESVKLTKGGGIARLVVIGVNAAESAPTSDLYHRMRDQVWFATRDWLRDGGAIPDDGRLHGELVAPLYAFDTSGRYVVEPKAKTKARLGRSPDRADALGLAVFRAPIVTVGYRGRVIDDL